MLRWVAGGLASIAVVGGGAAAVHYGKNGSATVKVKDHGVTRTVKLGGPGGATFSCPAETNAKLTPVDIQGGRIKLTIQDVERELKQLETQYPGGAAPGSVVSHYNGLVRRDRQLVTAFNQTIARHNEIIRSDCDQQ
jgi:hypothetical protein